MSRTNKTGVRGLYRGPDGAFQIDLRWRDAASGEPRRYREKLPVTMRAPAAKARAKAILEGALDGTFDPDREAPIALRAAFDRYLAACELAGLRSTRSRRTHAAAICAFFGEGAPLEEVAAFDAERLKASLRAGRSPATVNRHLGTLKAFARWAQREGVLTRGRAAELRDVRLLREPEGRVRWLSPDELAAVARLDGWLRPIVDAILATGARRTEITALRWRDVDLAHGELVLRHTKNRKTRHVPIAAPLRAVLTALPRGAPDDYVFAVPSRASKRAPETLRRSDAERRGDVVTIAWRRFCQAQGLADLRVHDLRHHAATMIRRAGYGLDVVAAVLGHGDVRVSARYAHLGRSELAAATEAAGASIVARPLPTGRSRKSRNHA